MIKSFLKNNFLTLFLLISVSLFAKVVTAQTNSKVKYLFQSTYERNKFVLVNDSELRILFINSECVDCFSKAQEILEMSPRKEFIILSATNSLQTLINKVNSKNISEEVKKIIYYDPGRRFETEFKLSNAESIFLLLKKDGTLYSNYKFELSKSLRNPYQLKVW